MSDTWGYAEGSVVMSWAHGIHRFQYRISDDEFTAYYNKSSYYKIYRPATALQLKRLIKNIFLAKEMIVG